MRTAYLILFFDVRSGVPVFERAGIYSEDAFTLTTDLSGRTCTVTAWSAEAPTFDGAKSTLLADLKICPFYNKWIWEHLE